MPYDSQEPRYSANAPHNRGLSNQPHRPQRTRTQARRPRPQGKRHRRRSTFSLGSLHFPGLRQLNSQRRMLIVGVLGILLVLFLVFVISSCVHACSKKAAPEVEKNPVDSRVAAGVSEDLTKEFSTALNQGENLKWIAEHAADYKDPKIPELALKHPEAIDFVANYPSSDGKASAYEEKIEKGTAPKLFTWDSRWGGVSFGSSILAVNGSGPTALSMAYMGLTGKGDKTPADIAELVTKANDATGDSGMHSDFVENHLDNLGLRAQSYDSSAANINALLDQGTYLLAEVKENAFGDNAPAHWVLIASENADGSVMVYDPTSPEVSSHPWDSATVAAATQTLYVVSASESAE